MEERDPLKFTTSIRYTEDAQIESLEDLENHYEDKDNIKPAKQEQVTELIDNETTEPDLMFLCKQDPEACELLQECSKLARSNKWKTIKEFLEKKEDIRLSTVDQKSGIQYRSFIKNFYLGIANFRLRNYQEALANFKGARKINEHYQVSYNIALCYIKLGNLENAVFYLEEATQKNQNFFYAHYNLIKIYLKKNNINDAFLVYRDYSDYIKKLKEKEKISQKTGLPLARNSVINFNTLQLFKKIGAECLFAKQLYQECVYTILEALKFNPNDIELWFLYAKIFVMKKNFPMSIALLKKALEIEPDYLEAKRLLSFLEKNNE